MPDENPATLPDAGSLRSAQQPVEPLAVSTRTACQILSCSRGFLDELDRRGEILSFRDGRKFKRYVTQSLHAYVVRRVAAHTSQRLQPQGGGA
jgi:hypothetical protein